MAQTGTPPATPPPPPGVGGAPPAATPAPAPAPAPAPPAGGAANLGQTGATNVANAAFMPVQPKFGGLSQVDATTWVAWTGGAPKADWTSLQDPSPSFIEPNQYRPSSITSQAKGQKYRVQGLDTKFTRDSDLMTFQRNVMQHLTMHGLDTIAYLKDPITKTEVVPIVNDHGRFTLLEGVTLSNATKSAHFDQYDLSNDRDASRFLINSLDEELQTQMHENCNKDDTFVTHWLNLINIIRSVSIDRFDGIKARIKKRAVSDYRHENIEEMATDYTNDWKELHGAAMHDQNLTMTMLNSILEAGGQNNEDFRHPLRNLKERLEAKLLEIRHLDYVAAHLSMVNDGLDVKSVLKFTKEKYRKLYDQSRWPPAQHAKDSKALNPNYGKANKAVADNQSLRSRIVNALIQTITGEKDVSDDECLNCGKKGHWAKDCPLKKKRNKRGNQGGKSGKRSNGRSSNRPKSTKPPPPKPGESEIKTINGKKMHWCQKCDRWTVSHGTENHKSKEELQAEKGGKASVARLSYDLHPSAHKLTVRDPAAPPIWMLFLKFFLGMIMLGLALPVLYDLAKSMIANVGLREILVFMSGSISASLLRSLDKQVVPRNVRYRSGPNFLKKVRRRYYKPRPSSRRFKAPRPCTAKGCHDLSHRSVECAPRFRNLGRPARYERPQSGTIRQMRMRIGELEGEVNRLNRRLTVLQQTVHQRLKRARPAPKTSVTISFLA